MMNNKWVIPIGILAGTVVILACFCCLHEPRRQLRSSLSGPRRGFNTVDYIHDIRRDDEHENAIIKEQKKPSFCLVCEAILSQNDRPTRPMVHISENEQVCAEENKVSDAITTMFLSTWLAEQGRMKNGFNVEYRHHCNRLLSSKGLIQHALPSPLMLEASMNIMDGGNLVQLCERLVQTVRSKPNGYFESTEVSNLLSQFPAIMFSNIHGAADAARKHRAFPSVNHGILSPSLDSREDGVMFDTAVIHIPCQDELCTNILALPYFSFLAYIPSSVRAADVVVDPACDEKIRQCRPYVEGLLASLQKMNPWGHFNLIFAKPSSLDLIIRMVAADYVLCSSGFGRSCLFPALADQPNRHGSFFVMDKPTRNQLSVIYPSGEQPPHIVFPSFLSPVAGLQEAGSIQATVFAKKQPDPSLGVCRFLRGREGHWVQDLQLATNAQYSTPCLHHSGASDLYFKERVARGETPRGLLYRPPTTYVWEERDYPICHVSQVDRNGLCVVLRRLNVQRLFFLGDSLSLQQALSLWMLMSPERDTPSDDKYLERTVQCDAGFLFVIQFVRNDELLETGQDVSAINQAKNCHHYCYPWKENYLASTSRTITIVNTGAHLHSRTLFNTAMRRFVEEFDGLDRVNDIVFMRTLVPGHKNCGRPGLKPFEDFLQYVEDVKGQTAKDTYNWDVFASYNDFMGHLIRDRRTSSRVPKARMELLDVFPMTVLRPDGHIADEFKVPEARRTDCLHYAMPGPIDWWNHLLFSNVEDIMLEEKQG